MGLWKNIVARVDGSYRRKERIFAGMARKAIIAALDADIIPDKAVAGYLRRWLPYLEKEESVGRLTRLFGNKLSRAILGLERSDVTPDPKTRYEWLESEFGTGSDCLRCGDITLPRVANDPDMAFFSSYFDELILPEQLGEDAKDIQPYFCPEGGYEHGDGVRIRRGDVVFDCGANAGFFAALAASRGCTVYAFEPLHLIRETYLDKTAALNKGIAVCPYALSDRIGTQVFDVMLDNLGASRKSEAAAPKGKSATEDVRTTTIDDFVAANGVKRIDFLKADIEGAERQMLRGAASTLREFAPKLAICTYHLPDDPKVLKQLILDAQPKYAIFQDTHKLYAHLP